MKMNPPKAFDVVDFAYQIIEMDRQRQRLEDENAELREYRQKYIDLLHSSIGHSGHMLSGMLQLAMKPGVMDAIAKANAS